MLGETAATSSLMFCFKSTLVLGFFSVHLALEISSIEVLRLGTLVPTNIEVPTKYPESRQNRCFFKYVSAAKTRCSTDQRSMAAEKL
jgi:hypothetical protein